MRSAFLLVAALFAVSPAHAAQDCSKEVFAAFEKQRTSKAFRVSMTQPTAEGPVQMTIDYMPPDRMLQTVVSPSMPGEQQTMLVGDRAFAGSGGGFEELLPQFAQSVVAEVRDAVGAPVKDLGVFACLGKVTFEGREFLGYRTDDSAASRSTSGFQRTIYVDPATGLPAFNVIMPEAGGNAVMTAAYSYPDDIEIVAPANAPVQKLRH
jgi:hypothetical protein